MTTALPTARDLGLDRRPDWTLDARCASVLDDEIWYPPKGGSTREAKKICRGCPVIAECLAYALANGERFGVWGGTSEKERRRMPTPRPAHSARWERGEFPCTRCHQVLVTEHGLTLHERTHLAIA